MAYLPVSLPSVHKQQSDTPGKLKTGRQTQEVGPDKTQGGKHETGRTEQQNKPKTQIMTIPSVHACRPWNEREICPHQHHM